MKKQAIRYFFLLSFSLFAFWAEAQVTADFTADKTSGCAPLSGVQFTSTSTGTITSYSWNFGNGNTSTLQNPIATYTNPGTYTVRLTVGDGINSDVEEKVAYITVFENPTADFTINPATGCTGVPVTLSDNSQIGGGAISSWDWNYGDGTTETVTVDSVEHAFAAQGIYPVSVIVTDVNGCTDNITENVTIVGAPQANFTADPLLGCSTPLVVTFDNTSNVIGSANYSWDFGDGNTFNGSTPTHTYTTEGLFDVTLIITQGNCSDTLVRNNYINVGGINADFSVNNDTLCEGSSATFGDLSVPAATSWSWNFGDGGSSTLPSPSHTYNSAGVYSVSLIVSNSSGCSDTATKTAYITVLDTPDVNFSADTIRACQAPLLVNFTDQTTSAAGLTSWAWDFGDGNVSSSQNPSNTYNSTGSFNVRLTVTDANGCSGVLRRAGYIDITPPDIDFVADSLEGCITLGSTFTTTVTSPNDPVATYDWDFGNGTTSTSSSSVYNQYPVEGVYTVSVTVTTNTGCTATETKTDYIRCGRQPTANFTVNQQVECYGTSLSFTDLSAPPVPVNGWEWIMGDGGIVEGEDSTIHKNPTYTYGDTGIFTVTFIAKNNGCEDEITFTDFITIQPALPNFSFTLDCDNPYDVTMTDASGNADIVSWDFGDGTTRNSVPSIDPPFTHTYATRGSKTVTITAENFITGCIASAARTFVIAEPIASFTADPDTGCAPLRTAFTDNSQDAVSWAWTYSNGESPVNPSLRNPIDTFNLPGLYTVMLVVTDTNNCRDTSMITNLINVLGPSVTQFAADTTIGCAPLPILFTNGTISDSTITSHTWDFGDGTSRTTTTDDTITHVFTSEGTFTIELIVTDANGCMDSVTRTNYIQPSRPTASFVVDTFACRTDTLLFDGSASTGLGQETYTWDFGDGRVDTYTSVSVTHEYQTDSMYGVTLTVTDINGCTATYTDSILILKPTASLSATVLSEGCGNKKIQFNDLSTGFVDTWSWDFGNNAPGVVLQNPEFTYTSPGVYDVSLIVTNLGGCADTVTLDSLVVVPGPVGTYSYVPTSGCNPLTVTFSVISDNSTVYKWDFGDGTGLVDSTGNDVTHTYTQDIVAFPILTLGNVLPDSTPCEIAAPLPGDSIVVVTIVDVDAGPNVVQLKEDSTLDIDPIVTGINEPAVYEWTSAGTLDGIDCPTCDEVTISNTGQDEIYYITVTDTLGGGCIGKDTIRIIHVPCVTSLNPSNVITPNGDGINDIFKVDDIVCSDEEFELYIFNRWGQELFRTDHRNEYWDGRTTSGVLVAPGVYFYVIVVSGESKEGFIQVLR